MTNPTYSLRSWLGALLFVAVAACADDCESLDLSSTELSPNQLSDVALKCKKRLMMALETSMMPSAEDMSMMPMASAGDMSMMPMMDSTEPMQGMSMMPMMDSMAPMMDSMAPMMDSMAPMQDMSMMPMMDSTEPMQGMSMMPMMDSMAPMMDSMAPMQGMSTMPMASPETMIMDSPRGVQAIIEGGDDMLMMSMMNSAEPMSKMSVMPMDNGNDKNDDKANPDSPMMMNDESPMMVSDGSVIYTMAELKDTLGQKYGHKNLGVANGISGMTAADRMMLFEAITETEMFRTNSLTLAYVDVSQTPSVDIMVPGSSDKITVTDFGEGVKKAVISVLMPSVTSFTAAGGLVKPPLTASQQVSSVFLADRLDANANIVHDVPFGFTVPRVAQNRKLTLYSHTCTDTCQGVVAEVLDAVVTTASSKFIVKAKHTSAVSAVSTNANDTSTDSGSDSSSSDSNGGLYGLLALIVIPVVLLPLCAWLIYQNRSQESLATFAPAADPAFQNPYAAKGPYDVEAPRSSYFGNIPATTPAATPPVAAGGVPKSAYAMLPPTAQGAMAPSFAQPQSPYMSYPQTPAGGMV